MDIKALGGWYGCQFQWSSTKGRIGQWLNLCYYCYWNIEWVPAEQKRINWGQKSLQSQVECHYKLNEKSMKSPSHLSLILKLPAIIRVFQIFASVSLRYFQADWWSPE